MNGIISLGGIMVQLNKTLLERLKKRNDSNDSIERRMSTDREDFKDFNDYDLKITDAEYDPEFILSLIK